MWSLVASPAALIAEEGGGGVNREEVFIERAGRGVNRESGV